MARYDIGRRAFLGQSTESPTQHIPLHPPRTLTRPPVKLEQGQSQQGSVSHEATANYFSPASFFNEWSELRLRVHGQRREVLTKFRCLGAPGGHFGGQRFADNPGANFTNRPPGRLFAYWVPCGIVLLLAVSHTGSGDSFGVLGGHIKFVQCLDLSF